jgi:hypothetical protein
LPWAANPEARPAALAVLGLLIGWAVFAMRVPERCTYSPLDGLTSFALVTASIGGFVGGHLLGRWIEASNIVRKPDRDNRPGGGVRGILSGAAGTRAASVAVQGVLILFLALGVALLAYETLALVNTRLNWPITYYARCFSHTNPVPAGLGALALCSLLGQWVWYRGGDD